MDLDTIDFNVDSEQNTASKFSATSLKFHVTNLHVDLDLTCFRFFSRVDHPHKNVTSVEYEWDYPQLLMDGEFGFHE